ncbi:MAG: hypothetical protein J6S75_11065, partial [Thermoguttaceae bacterium]|nr:hypothetical protein [Thermoguttaceae bacterium]
MRQHRVFFTLALFLGLAMGAAACDSPAKKTGKIFFDRDTCVMETTPFVWEGKMLLFASVRRGGAEHTPAQLSLQIRDPESGEVLSTFGSGCSLGCAFVNQGTLHVFAARQPEGESWFRDIVHFCSSDLKTWREIPAVAAENENLFNSSVCRDGDGFLMAYESNN